MRTSLISRIFISVVIGVTFLTSGCALNFYKQSPKSKQQIKALKQQVSDLEKERAREKEQFESVKEMLQKRLRDQIDKKNISVSMDDRGIVIVLSDEILFDSGRAEVKSSARPVLNKVAVIVNDEVPNKKIGVTGHTDNVPIRQSNWKSNWELSTARATNVLHYLESKGVSPRRLSATGYGEYRPVASNSTAKGRAQNRRVEIVILPQFEEKKSGDLVK